MNTEANVLTFSLAEAGLYVTSCSQVFSGGWHHRYTLRQLGTRKFIAFFCWYERPAVEREFNPRPKEVGMVTQITPTRLPSPARKLAKKWLKDLRRRHPV